MTADPVEVMARALEEGDVIFDDWREVAKVCLSALSAAGMKVLPEIPTEEMVKAAHWLIVDAMADKLTLNGRIYREMWLAAASHTRLCKPTNEAI